MTSGGFQLSVTAPSVEGLWRLQTVCRPDAAVPDSDTGGAEPVAELLGLAARTVLGYSAGDDLVGQGCTLRRRGGVSRGHL